MIPLIDIECKAGAASDRDVRGGMIKILRDRLVLIENPKKVRGLLLEHKMELKTRLIEYRDYPTFARQQLRVSRRGRGGGVKHEQHRSPVVVTKPCARAKSGYIESLTAAELNRDSLISSRDAQAICHADHSRGPQLGRQPEIASNEASATRKAEVVVVPAWIDNGKPRQSREYVLEYGCGIVQVDARAGR